MPSNPGSPIVAALLGPTATGKSTIALEIAPMLGAEIVSVDSMQVYRGMDIGTAKPSLQSRLMVPHHMLDVVEASEDFSVAMFQAMARRVVEEIASRGKAPLLVGGTGLYFEAVVNKLRFPPGSVDDELRQRLIAEAARDLEGMKARLRRIDPVFAAGEGFENPRRVVRALEVYERTGTPFSKFQNRRTRQASYCGYCGVVLNAPRRALYGVIEKRVDGMMEAGLVDEVRKLTSGPGLSRTASQALGYKEILDHLDRGIPLEDTINNIKKRSRNYAKRQLTWFRHIPDLYWIDLDEEDLVSPSERVIAAVRDYLRNGLHGSG
jgi:tRNA dimethylallyltransferase